MKGVITISGYRFNIQPLDGLDGKQHLYNDFIPIFTSAIDLLARYTDNHPLSPKDKSVYMKQSRLCKKQITELQTTFIDGTINLSEEQHSLLSFFVGREIRGTLDELSDQLKTKFSYPRLHEHFCEHVSDNIFWRILSVIPEDTYYALNAQFPKPRMSR